FHGFLFCFLLQFCVSKSSAANVTFIACLQHSLISNNCSLLIKSENGRFVHPL
ncbi:hypothetical protein EC950183_4031, partial [Escherichia coli 95.0183]